ncbi:HNH endonuclease, partial [Salmonella enterica]|nr:HNH endonuclease [Salmonella enterica]EJV4163139.1 HNH endonuclease [Salmonella enterica]
MVAKLHLPEYNSIEVLRTVISEREKYKDFYENLTDDWIEHVDNYLEHHGNPQIIRPLELKSYISKKEVNEEEKKTTNDNKHIPALERLVLKR